MLPQQASGGSVRDFTIVDRYNAGVLSYNNKLYESSAINMETFLNTALSVGLNNTSGITELDLDNAVQIAYKSYVELSMYVDALRVLNIYFSYKDTNSIDTSMVANKVLISGNLNRCKDATSAVVSSNKGGTEIIKAYLSTSCADSLGKSIVDYIIDTNQPNDIKTEAALKTKNATWLLLLSSSIDFQALDVEQKDNFARYFFQVEAYEPFWNLVGSYTSPTTVSLSLKRLHQTEKYDEYITMMNSYKDTYTLPADNYCLLVDSYKQTNQSHNYDCALIAKCSSDNLTYNTAVCYSESGQWEEFHRKYETLTAGEKDEICVIAPYVVANGVYTNKMLDDFKGCRAVYKEGVQKSLYGRLDSDGLLYFSTGTSVTDLYYRTYGYILKRDMQNATETAALVTKKELQMELYRVIKNSQNISTTQ